MNESVKRLILDTIAASDRILITRHFRPDGDAIGASMGLARILRLTWPEKDIRVINEDSSEYIFFLDPEDGPAPDEWYRDALAIVVDTGTFDRISNKKTGLCPKLIKIDHHIDEKPYGDISWVENERSSLCEMIADLVMTFPETLKIDSRAAFALYTGLVTDSGRFHFNSVNGDTMRCAAFLLDQEIDTDRLFSYLDLEDFEYYRFESWIHNHMKRTENGVAYIVITAETREKFGLSYEQASNAVSFLSGITGSLIWLAFIEYGDSIRVRLRSRFVTVQELASLYGGGGHACAAGATLHSRRDVRKMLSQADSRLKEYKETHTDWR